MIKRVSAVILSATVILLGSGRIHVAAAASTQSAVHSSQTSISTASDSRGARPTDVSARQRYRHHYRHHGYRHYGYGYRSYYPRYYARPYYYEPDPYYVPAPFGFSFGFGPFW